MRCIGLTDGRAGLRGSASALPLSTRVLIAPFTCARRRLGERALFDISRKIFLVSIVYFFEDLTLIPHTNRPFWCGPKIASIGMRFGI